MSVWLCGVLTKGNRLEWIDQAARTHRLVPALCSNRGTTLGPDGKRRCLTHHKMAGFSTPPSDAEQVAALEARVRELEAALRYAAANPLFIEQDSRVTDPPPPTGPAPHTAPEECPVCDYPKWKDAP